MSIEILNPGSEAAQRAGCTCPIIDNHFGEGIPNKKGTVDFWYNKDCPIHNEKEDPLELDIRRFE